MAKAGCSFLCMCLCFGLVFCRFGFPSYGPEDYQHDRQQSFKDNFYSPDPNNVQNVGSQFVYPSNVGESLYTDYGTYVVGNGQYWSHGRPNEYPTDYPNKRLSQYFEPPDSVHFDNDSKEADFQANRPNEGISKDTLNKEVQSQFPAFDKRGSEIEYEDRIYFGPVNSSKVKGFATNKPQELNPNSPEMKLPVQKYDRTREKKKFSGSENDADSIIFPNSDNKDDEIELPDDVSPATIPELTPMSTSLPEITPGPDHLPGFTSAPSSVLNPIPTRLPGLTPVPTSLPELTPVPTSLPELTPVPKTESRNDLNFNFFRENCETADNGIGSCISIHDCQPYMSLLQNAQTKLAAQKILNKKAHCGFEKKIPKVCCPRSSIPTALPPVETTTPAPTTTSTPPSTTAQGTVKMPGDKDFNMFPLPPECGLSNASLSRVVNGVPAKLGENCQTADNGVGSCISICDCRPYMSLLQVAKTRPAAQNTLRKVHCGFEKKIPKVCCPRSSIPTALPPVETTTPAPTTTSTPPSTTAQGTVKMPGDKDFNMFPLPPECGLSNASLSRVVNGVPAKLGENCQTADNGVGSCISICDCRPYMSLLQVAKTILAAQNTLRKVHCGFEKKIPKVCCPRSSIPTALPPVETTTPAPTTTSTPPSTTAQGSVKMPGDKDFNMFPLPPECGLSNASLSRVVNGVPAKLGAFPWMALLGYQGRRNPGVRWLCGGSLITSKHVLTAAHCIRRYEEDLYIVRLGELDLAREDEGATPVDVPIKQKVMHEEYSAKTNDVGLLVLQRVVEFTSLIRPICIPFDSTLRAQNFEKYRPLIAGWGNIEFAGASAKHLQVTQLPVVSNAYCAERYSTYKAQTIDERMLCAGYKRGGKDACQGDSGGPLMQPIWNPVTETTFFYIIGVVSFGNKCAEPGFPGVYSRVTHFVPWIQENVIKTSYV